MVVEATYRRESATTERRVPWDLRVSEQWQAVAGRLVFEHEFVRDGVGKQLATSRYARDERRRLHYKEDSTQTSQGGDTDVCDAQGRHMCELTKERTELELQGELRRGGVYIGDSVHGTGAVCCTHVNQSTSTSGKARGRLGEGMA